MNWIAFLIAALALFGSGYALGDRNASSTCASKQIQSQQAAQADADETDTRREGIAQEREASRDQIRVVYRTIKEKADENPIAVDCGLDAERLRLWNTANAGKSPSVLGKLDYRLSGSAAGEVGQAAGPSGQPHRINGAVQPVSRPAEKTSGVRE